MTTEATVTPDPTRADEHEGGDKSSLITEDERRRLTEARDRIRAEFLYSRENRPRSTGRPMHLYLNASPYADRSGGASAAGDTSLENQSCRSEKVP